MKFIILAHQRSGTHYLASLLNSHPDLTCYDEIFLKGCDLKMGYKPFKELEDGEGCIIMYDQFIDNIEEIEEVVDEFNIINLHRDVEETARSFYITMHREKYNLPAHTEKEIKPPKIEVPEYDLQMIKSRILTLRCSVAQLLEVFNRKTRIASMVYNLINDKILKDLQEFLGVKPQKLTTNLKKTNYGKL